MSDFGLVFSMVHPLVVGPMASVGGRQQLAAMTVIACWRV
jgi:hypothetical protein